MQNMANCSLRPAMKKEAIQQWEKGIEADPNYSGNYYYAAKYYAANNLLWSALYAELFVNLESLSTRTVEIKNLLLADYTKIFSSPGLQVKKKSDFEKAVADALLKATTYATNISMNRLDSARTYFVEYWHKTYATQMPYRLFEYQWNLLQQNYFTAYNQWLFAGTIDSNAYAEWQKNNKEVYEAFQKLQRNTVFKISEGIYYPH